MPVWRSCPLRPNRSSGDLPSLGQQRWGEQCPAWASALASAMADDDAAAAAGVDMAVEGSRQESGCSLATAVACLVPVASGRLPFRSYDAA